jgi:hypothetical protein
MNEVCWHYHSVPNILRYISNRLRHLWHDPDSDLSRLPTAENAVPETQYAKVMAGRKAMPESK